MLRFLPGYRPTSPLYSRDNLGGETRISGAFVFQSLTLPPTTKPVEPSRKTDPFTITSHCTYPLKRPQSLSGAKNAKRQGNTRPNQKNASESLSGRCITMHESDSQTVSTVQKGERVKKVTFVITTSRFMDKVRQYYKHLTNEDFINEKNRYGILFKEFYPCLILLHFIFYHRKFESKPNKYRIIYIYTYISFWIVHIPFLSITNK
ncbi:hypothetical protein GZ439_004604 [Salmonella enterica]|nr:hypothetical protein [Salmonella enterica]